MSDTENVQNTEMEFPQQFVHKDDNNKKIVALDAVQAAAFEKADFKPAGKYVKKKEQ